ncbi:hypothetical protein ACFWVF_02135 [Streptomyces sp. NPDC058659]|uniref:hypothetical protein n=1 Tax=unclassified Streptomyces TaxID=2593676 RepID=UPI0036504410
MADAEVSPGLEASPALREAVRRLEALTGRVVADMADGHARWELYRAALASDTARPHLLPAVAAETDAALASAVVGDALERVPRAERASWVRALAPTARAFSERRARELGTLEDLLSGAGAPTPGAELIDGWSDWLQLRIAAEVSDESLLRLLAATGRTKRVRRTAAGALG